MILAFCGVCWSSCGPCPLPIIIGLGLAFSFAFTAWRKKIAVDAQTGMLVETLWLLPVAANSAVRHHRHSPAIWARTLVAQSLLMPRAW